MSDRVLTISTVARNLGVTLRTLRFYEEKKLIKPIRDGQHRLYSAVDVDRLERVCAWRRAGLNVQEIRQLLADLDRGLSIDERLSGLLDVAERKVWAAVAAVREARATVGGARV